MECFRVNAPAYDIAIIGAGIVGLATAHALAEHAPSLRLCILEKESDVAAHQTGHNSGVIHAGIYYAPGSLKASLCREGARLLAEFCAAHGIGYELCGKVVVATNQRELPVLDELYRRGVANGVPGLRRIGPDELREIEPNAGGLAALLSPSTGIIDYGEVARAMAAGLRAHGADLRTGSRVLGIHTAGGGLRIATATGEVAAGYMINCAGLYSDMIARMTGAEPNVRIIPFRGEYYFIRPERRHLVRGLIYPVPDPRLPFLGVHFTRTIHGDVEAGPNAVLAFAREGYTRWQIRPGELWDTLTYPGFRALAARYWRSGLSEYYRSFRKAEFVRALQRLVPAIQPADVAPGGAGVRAQAVERNGKLADDFCIAESPRALHVLNAPSPAATAALAIGRYVAGRAAAALDLSPPQWQPVR